MAKRRARERPGAKNDCLVDWSSLTPEVLEVAGQFLQHHDLLSAASVCKRWREALLSLLVRKLRVLLADVLANPGVARTTRSRARFANITRLLDHATYQTSVEVLVSERRWPCDAQVQAFLSALTRRPAVKELRFRVVEQLARLSTKQAADLTRIVQQLCASVASTQQLTSLVLESRNIEPQHLPTISSSLAQLPSLQHLTLREDNLALHHLAPITSSLTNLTSIDLTISDASSTHDDSTKPNAMLQHLALLTRLQMLKVHVTTGPSGVVTLPPMPHLKHLSFQPDNFHDHDDDDENSFVLLLSAEHCVQLESLDVPAFQAVAGVASMDKLQHLRVMYLPAAQQQAAQQQALQYPQLQHICVDEHRFYYNECSMQQLAALLQQAPAVDSIHLHCPFTDEGNDDEDTALLVQALSSSGRAPLRSLCLPKEWGELEQQLVALAAQQGQLQQLTLHEPLPPAQYELLRSITSLRDLNLSCSPQALPLLPPGLTALTYNTTCSTTDSVALVPPPPAQPLALPLRRLETYSPAVVLRALCMRQLSNSLTSLRTKSTLDGSRISQLKQLAELECKPWAGMAQQLAGLAQLRSLKLHNNYVAVVEQQVQQLGALTQLRELSLAGLYGAWPQGKAGHTKLGLKVAEVLPNCMVVAYL